MLKRVLCMMACIMMLFGLFAGCKKEEVNFVYDPTDLGTNAANVLMGGGLFAYDDGFIYFYGGDGIIEYNMETGKTVCLEGLGSVKSQIYLSDEFIYVLQYNLASSLEERGFSLTAVTKDGNARQKLFGWEHSLDRPYLEGMELYYKFEGSLYRQNLETGEEDCLISSVGRYYLDDKYIYALGEGENKEFLFRSPRDQIAFEKIHLSFVSWGGVYAYDDKIFYKQETVAFYENGEETPLPISSFSYQILDNYLIYKDEAEKDTWLSLKAYNLETGEIKLLSKNVSTLEHFCIFEQRYICFVTVDEIGYSQYMLYDWQTGELTQMYPKPNT